MAGSIRDDELTAGGREVTIGNIDRDALFALGPQAIGEVSEVDLTVTGDIGGALEGRQLILHD